MFHTQGRKEGYLCASTNDSKLDYQQNNSAMEERKKTISPLPIDQLPCPRMSVRVFFISLLLALKLAAQKGGEGVREKCKIRVFVCPSCAESLLP